MKLNILLCSDCKGDIIVATRPVKSLLIMGLKLTREMEQKALMLLLSTAHLYNLPP